MRIQNNKEHGFSIIEVSIVLALVGLIMLIIFLIIPQFTRTRRNTERKQQTNYIASQLETYSSNSSDVYPGDGVSGIDDERCMFMQTYLKSGACTLDSTKNCQLSSETLFSVCYHNRKGTHDYISDFDEISIEPGHWCNVDGPDDPATLVIDNPIISGGNNDNNLNNYAVWTRIEGGSVFCVDNKE